MDKDTTVIKESIDETRRHLTQSLGELEDRVKTSVQQVNPAHQIRKHPWVAIGTSVATGVYLGWAVYRRFKGGRRALVTSAAAFASPKMGRVIGIFHDEIEMAKGMLVGAALRRTAKLVKNALPQLKDPVDKILSSALGKVEPRAERVVRGDFRVAT